MKTFLMYGDFPGELQKDLVEAIHKGWLDAGATWTKNNQAIQQAIARRIRKVP